MEGILVKMKQSSSTKEVGFGGSWGQELKRVTRSGDGDGDEEGEQEEEEEESRARCRYPWEGKK